LALLPTLWTSKLKLCSFAYFFGSWNDDDERKNEGKKKDSKFPPSEIVDY
jgi:hypothetical protein